MCQHRALRRYIQRQGHEPLRPCRCSDVHNLRNRACHQRRDADVPIRIGRQRHRRLPHHWRDRAGSAARTRGLLRADAPHHRSTSSSRQPAPLLPSPTARRHHSQQSSTAAAPRSAPASPRKSYSTHTPSRRPAILPRSKRPAPSRSQYPKHRSSSALHSQSLHPQRSTS